jgi:hypothetical protein
MTFKSCIAASTVVSRTVGTTISPPQQMRRKEVWIAIWSMEELVVCWLVLKNGRSRQNEEELVCRILLNTIVHSCGLSELRDVSLSGFSEGPDEFLKISQISFSNLVSLLFSGQISWFRIEHTGHVTLPNVSTTNSNTTDNSDNAIRKPQLILSGSFNPFHRGHRNLMKSAQEFVKIEQCAFELPVMNADKPTLSQDAILDRISQFAGVWPIYVTKAPTFVEKAKLFPGATFVVGYDTAVRIVQKRFYDNDEQKMMGALQEFRALGCSFLAGGRAIVDNKFYNISTDPTFPSQLKCLFQEIPEEKFREDVSSTELREKGEKGHSSLRILSD